MATAREKLEQFKNLNIVDLVGQSMLDDKEPLVALMVAQQQSEHVTGDDKPFRPYSRNYAAKKRKLGKSGDVDYDLTGEMHAEMNLSVKDGTYEFNSPAVVPGGELKSYYLKKRDGGKAFSLSPENNAKILPTIQQTLVTKINTALDI